MPYNGWEAKPKWNLYREHMVVPVTQNCPTALTLKRAKLGP